MKIIRSYRVELDPNNVQRTLLCKHAGCARFAYNWGLSRRIEEYKTTGKSSNAIAQHKELNDLKPTDFPWMYDVSKCAPQEALRNLDKSYKNFFRQIKEGKKTGFPKFKSRKNGIGSFTLTGSVYAQESVVQLPRLGTIRLKESNYIPTEGINILSATCSERAGHWFVSVACEQEVSAPEQATGEPVGVDLGIKELAVCSNGKRFQNNRSLKKKQKKMRRLQRQHSKKKKGSKNRQKSKKKIAKLHYQISCMRNDSLHKMTTAIVAKTKPNSERPRVIVLEDLNVSGMTKNHKLAKAILDAGLSEFRRQIEYKSKWYGSEVMIADRFYPSSKTCNVCKAVNSELTLKDREWACSNCGSVLDRDLNAAINLENLATTGSSPGSHACGDHAPCGHRNRNRTRNL